MSLLHLISFLATLLGLAFILICLASGLLYVAEIIEEHSQAAKRIGQQIAHGVILLHIGIYFSDGLPFHLTILGIFSHLIYLTNFSKSWPMISLNSISFLSSCSLVILDHFAWFFYFTDRNSSHHPYHSNLYKSSPAAFAICVWMVPFYLFLSLSANDNVLPSRIGQSLNLNLNFLIFQTH
ncbi:transmembrane adaptor Erv26 [Melampsora americana]|nr:transmembrane adaptor Erv26 [Melampsora americana]